MTMIHFSKEVSFSVDLKEKEILQKAHDILNQVRQKWDATDVDSWDSDEYWEIRNAVEMLEKQFGCTKAN